MMTVLKVKPLKLAAFHGLMNNTESPWEGKNIREELRGTL
jgi:hypothetical protein